MLGEPRLHLGRFVGAIVIHDEMQIEVLLHDAIDLVEKADELPRP